MVLKKTLYIYNNEGEVAYRANSKPKSTATNNKQIGDSYG